MLLSLDASRTYFKEINLVSHVRTPTNPLYFASPFFYWGSSEGKDFLSFCYVLLKLLIGGGEGVEAEFCVYFVIQHLRNKFDITSLLVFEENDIVLYLFGLLLKCRSLSGSRGLGYYVVYSSTIYLYCILVDLPFF